MRKEKLVTKSNLKQKYPDVNKTRFEKKTILR